jgi:AcrR family transcriptional regulator
MSTSKKRRYHHGELGPALIVATKTLLDKGGAAAVSLREAARRVGVSPTATYRHFASKESLLAATATVGFRELGAALAAASTHEPEALAAMGMAYVRFALARRGLFRLMFSPEVTNRLKYPELKRAADQAFGWLGNSLQSDASKHRNPRVEAIAAWALVHGLAQLFIDGILPEAQAETLTRAITSSPSRKRGRSR